MRLELQHPQFLFLLRVLYNNIVVRVIDRPVVVSNSTATQHTNGLFSMTMAAAAKLRERKRPSQAQT